MISIKTYELESTIEINSAQIRAVTRNCLFTFFFSLSSARAPSPASFDSPTPPPPFPTLFLVKEGTNGVKARPKEAEYSSTGNDFGSTA